MSSLLTDALAESDLPYNSPRRPKTRGFGPLGTGATVVVAIGTITAVIFAVFVSLPVGVAIIGLTAIFGGLGFWRDHHSHGPLEEASERIGWARQKLAGANLYIPGSLTVIGDYRVPGAVAKSRLTQAEDVYGHSYALLSYPQTGHHVLNMKANPDGAALADSISTEQADEKFSEWLAGLSTEPDLAQLAITMDIAPDAHPAVQREIQENLDLRSPALAQRMLTDCAAMCAGQGGATSSSYITMTFTTPADTDKAQLKEDFGAGAMRESLASRLAHLMAPIPATGAGPVKLMTGDDVIEVTRCAYNPGDRALYQELRSRGQDRPVMTWESAGPAGSEEFPGHYSHGDGDSITWETTGFIGSQVAAQVMKPLAKDPPPPIHSLRITWLYEPISPARSGFIANSDHAAAKQRKRSAGKDPSERVLQDARAAANARKAEANGKGLINVACLITATVLEGDTDTDTARAVKRAKSGIEHQAPGAKLFIRVVRRAQAPAFGVALGVLGLVPSAHLLIPKSIRKAG